MDESVEKNTVWNRKTVLNKSLVQKRCARRAMNNSGCPPLHIQILDIHQTDTYRSHYCISKSSPGPGRCLHGGSNWRRRRRWGLGWFDLDKAWTYAMGVQDASRHGFFSYLTLYVLYFYALPGALGMVYFCSNFSREK